MCECLNGREREKSRDKLQSRAKKQRGEIGEWKGEVGGGGENGNELQTVSVRHEPVHAPGFKVRDGGKG
jgi:hypothetical protein